MRFSGCRAVGVGICAASVLLGWGQGSGSDYSASVSAWRLQQAKDLEAPRGWLTVSGLFWLKEGVSNAGSAADNAIVLPTYAPAHLGTFTRTGSEIVFEPAEAGGPAKVTLGEVKVASLTFTPIVRGNRVGLRLYDGQSKALKTFKGLKWFPVQAKYRVQAHFTAYDAPKQVPITNVLGDVQMWDSPGYVTFTLGKQECKLVALTSGSGLFFNFHDLTSGKSTYPAGRFLDAPAPKDGIVDLDFNKATNPPCAFTNFATCPLPPQENFLTVSVTAGEKVHHPEE